MLQDEHDELTNTTKKVLNPNGSLLNIFIRLENRIDMYESSGYTFTMMLSEAGGLASLLYAFCRFTTIRFGKDMLLGSLIQVLFRSKTKAIQNQEPDPEINYKPSQ